MSENTPAAQFEKLLNEFRTNQTGTSQENVMTFDQWLLMRDGKGNSKHHITVIKQGKLTDAHLWKVKKNGDFDKRYWFVKHFMDVNQLPRPPFTQAPAKPGADTSLGVPDVSFKLPVRSTYTGDNDLSDANRSQARIDSMNALMERMRTNYSNAESRVGTYVLQPQQNTTVSASSQAVTSAQADRETQQAIQQQQARREQARQEEELNPPPQINTQPPQPEATTGTVDTGTVDTGTVAELVDEATDLRNVILSQPVVHEGASSSGTAPSQAQFKEFQSGDIHNFTFSNLTDAAQTGNFQLVQEIATNMRKRFRDAQDTEAQDKRVAKIIKVIEESELARDNRDLSTAEAKMDEVLEMTVEAATAKRKADSERKGGEKFRLVAAESQPPISTLVLSQP